MTHIFESFVLHFWLIKFILWSFVTGLEYMETRVENDDCAPLELSQIGYSACQLRFHPITLPYLHHYMIRSTTTLRFYHSLALAKVFLLLPNFLDST